MMTRDRLRHRVLGMAPARGPGSGPAADQRPDGSVERDARVVRVRVQRLGALRWRLTAGPVSSDGMIDLVHDLVGIPVSPRDVNLTAIGAPFSALPTVEATQWDLATGNLVIDLALAASSGAALHAGLYSIRISLRNRDIATTLEGLVQLPAEVSPADTDTPPPVPDYLAKDYESIRAAMLRRMDLLIPDWQDRDPADVGVMTIEALAYAADRLSYQQDAVAVEAYLDSARTRTSVKRHARLLGYTASDGVNSRVWISFTLQLGVGEDASVILPAGLDTLTGSVPPSVPPLRAVMDDGRIVYRTLETIRAHLALNRLDIYDWNLADFVLPAGSTSAVLTLDPQAPDDLMAEDLWVGRVLIFEQAAILAGGRTEPANPALRHAVRVSGVEFDPRLAVSSGATRAILVTWSEEDALPFEFQVNRQSAGRSFTGLSFVSGNCALADLGLSVRAQLLPDHPGDVPYRPTIDLPDQGATLVQSQRWDPRQGKATSATDAMKVSSRDAFPDLEVHSQFAPELAISEHDPESPQSGWFETWVPRHDLLSSGPNDRQFVVETGFDGRSTLRFGNDDYGALPPKFHRFHSRLRVARDPTETIGPDAIDIMAPDSPGWHTGASDGSLHSQEILSRALASISGVRNPLPALGGYRAEDKKTIRARAPRAADNLESLVTLSDYQSAAQALPDVSEALATESWSGATPVIRLWVRRPHGRPATPRFCDQIATTLTARCIAGRRISVKASGVCPTDIVLAIRPAPGVADDAAIAACVRAFDPSGPGGFFAPARWTMGKILYASDLIEHALAVEAVAAARLSQFARLGVAPLPDEASGGRPTPAALVPRAHEVITAGIATASGPSPLDGRLFIRIDRTIAAGTGT